jgi:predicted NBD/HSP70 family sugar kinase
MAAQQGSLRIANQATILEQLLERRTASRADLAKATGMSKPTTGKIVDDLARAGVVEEVKLGNGTRGVVGRPGKQVRLTTTKPRFVVIELGVQWTKMAALPPMPLDSEHWDAIFETPNDAEAWLERVTANALHLDIKRPIAVLASASGIVDERESRVLLSPNLHWTENADLPRMLRRVWASPFGLVQENRALALGEWGYGADDNDFLLVDIGEGMGGALMLGGRPYQGALPLSAEIGHTRLPSNDRLCGCGGHGCVETLASEKGLVRTLREATGDASTFGDVVRACEKEVPLWMRATLDAAGMAVGAALNTYGVRQVVLVGRVTELLPAPATDYLAGAIQRGTMWSRFEPLNIRFAPRRRARGLVLAALQRFVMPVDWAR